LPLPDPPNQLPDRHASAPQSAGKPNRTPLGRTGKDIHSTATASAKSPFRDPEQAALNLERVNARLPPSLISAVKPLLAEASDPDGALLLFERLSESSEAVSFLEKHELLAHYAIAIFGQSRFLGETLLQNLDLLSSLIRDENLDRSFSQEEFHEGLARLRAHLVEEDVSLALARFKRREYLRIVLRDVFKLAPLSETTAEISALADVLIEAALREAASQLRRRPGFPQPQDALGRRSTMSFSVLALGKLGGNELNYSSDVDLMFIYDDGEEPAGAKISRREYFIRLAQQITEILSRVTREGQVFRIDLRLRPQGGEGELAVSLSQALTYYAEVAHDWERQALIKVRYCAGNSALAREFIRAVQPYVYTEKVNFAAVKTALVARERMQKRRPTAASRQLERGIDVKIDRGGIRDIEFLVQCLQRVYGGTEPWLRSGGTLFSLQKLHDKGHISGREFDDLTNAYEFLRHLEHRLQLRDGRQTHRLPTSEADLTILQRAMAPYTREDRRGISLADLVRRRMGAVEEIYHRIVFQHQTRSRQQSQHEEFKLLSGLEQVSTDQLARQLPERLAADAPPLFEIVTSAELKPQTRRAVLRFLTSALASSERYAAVLRHQKQASRALRVFETSTYLTEILIRYPEEIATLAETERTAMHVSHGYLFEPSISGRWPSLDPFLFDPHSRMGPESQANFTRPTDPVFAYLAESPVAYADKLTLLRQHFRHRAFAVGARDIIESRDVYESFADITRAASDATAAAFSMAGSPQGLTVMALGRLGSGEFDFLSDADVLFVCEEKADRRALTRSAEQMMQALSAYTQEGTVFPLDARLRPRGREGELLISPTQLDAYFKHEAQPWEALMYTKMRFFAGCRSLAERAAAPVKTLFDRFAADATFADSVQEMRARLEAVEPGKSFKSSPGGSYDIDFITSFLMVKHSIGPKQGSLRDRLWRCVAAGCLDKANAAVLDHAAELLRTVEHICRLVVARPIKWLPATAHAREVTEQLTGKILRRNYPQGLENELVHTCASVRAVYEKVLSTD